MKGEVTVKWDINPYWIEFTIPGLPKVFSNSRHSTFFAISAEKRKWRKFVELAVGHRIPKTPLQVAKCTFVRGSSVEPDDDNLRISFKTVRDHLQALGIMIDDKPSNMPDPVYRWEKAKQKAGFIRVRVEEITNRA